ncbi:aspartate carbamoyltransferase catalytic subunit [Kroppenstedtia eburnea]|uniref:Aspartate carbamoyltransferase n=1 Tax=Kroppenstedtia eburnea TaxID=714067 RepID=A0A1N7J3V0_9BACL|nr:aspartate carbamoyltransferase catalytic subunit [Kroppenstedtia eburnea]QKI82481.1 aspartate carbamoyltransferase catalytic subunit [Kroppenstedtia eburnea]SIS44038.1 aspartate carbamoyltransferase [Kroppenstedtia eburnea]
MIETRTRTGHLIDTDQLSREEMEALFERAGAIRRSPDSHRGRYEGRFAANLFFEPSTRTRLSFEVAERKLGMEVLRLDEGSSSSVKGESFYDTLRTLSSVGVEVAVIRHTGGGLLAEMAGRSPGIALVNGGEGEGGHPTQALLDLFTLHRHFGTLSGLRVAIVGDLRHSRVARSNLQALQEFGARPVLSGPEPMRDPALEKDFPYLPMDEALRQADAVMMLRIQLERHREKLITSPADYRRQFGLTPERLERMPAHGVILHPGPVNRGVEIDGELVEHPRSKIFEQMENGVWIRMAVLERAIEGGL